MALGFGFNKAKVLASAEKFVQQGKLQNAIAEYEKVVKEDPKDLTVLNTIGDLYARVGQNEQAANYFRNVGDQYAQNGFTVKAIAIYKKLTKISPQNYENVNKLAELYTQQGLFNDARSQYMVVADSLLKSGDNSQAARIFQKILELDPENAHTQSKLADLYMKLGKKDEARSIYFSAAESLYSRGSYDAAEEALGKVITLDPNNQQALLLRGMIAADSGDSLSAVHYLEQVKDLDSRPDALRAIFRAKMQSSDTAGMEAVAEKLLNLHKDASAITGLAQWYIGNNRVTNGLKVYDKYADRLTAVNPGALKDALQPLMSRIKEEPEALAIMQRLLQRTGDTSQTAEILELQAHALAKKGEYAAARDLYQKLVEMEPENALHGQNVRQMKSKLGEDSATRILTPEEAAQAFMVEELSDDAPVVQQHYDPPVESAIEAALTDAELFVSYNVPMKAIAPLESVLPMAPRDVTVNQRLANLYARAERYGDAARVCQLLSDVYMDLGHAKESAKYLEASRKYSLRAPAPSATTSVPRSVAPPPLPPIATAPVSTAGQERFSPLEASPTRLPEPAIRREVPQIFEPEPVYTPEVPVHVEPPPEPVVEHHGDASVQEFSFDVSDHAITDPTASVVHEEFSATPPPPPPPPIGLEPELERFERLETKPADLFATSQSGFAPGVESAAEPEIEEVDASNEWEDMLSVESDADGPVRSGAGIEVERFRDRDMQPTPKAGFSGLTAGGSGTFYAVEDKVKEIEFYISQELWDEAKNQVLNLAEIAPDAPEITNLMSQVTAGRNRANAAGAAASRASMPALIPLESEPEVEIEIVDEPSAPAVQPKPIEIRPPETRRPPARPVEIPSRQIAASADDTSVLELPEEIVHPKKPSVASIPAPPQRPTLVTQTRPVASGQSTEDILSSFVSDLEQTELSDFVPAVQAHAEPLQNQTTSGRAQSNAASRMATSATRGAAASSNGEMQDAESAHVLNDILSELQEENDSAPEPEEDPETHYNLGIAFKEMGLLDEAIGELQKVCHAVDRGSTFSQPIQAYTWLAQCLVDKGAPEAAVRWYQKALQIPGMDDGSRCSIYYDLASAFEASGDKKAALTNFMEVYGSNIDFRDVASRIKTLKA